jgi:hypothetical protein
MEFTGMSFEEVKNFFQEHGTRAPEEEQHVGEGVFSGHGSCVFYTRSFRAELWRMIGIDRIVSTVTTRDGGEEVWISSVQI